MSMRWFLAASLAAGLWAQPANDGKAKAPPPKVLVAGENPAIRYLDKEGGKPISSANFWRVHWSPAGAGAVCFVTVTDSGANNLRIAIYDDEKVLDYVSKELMGALNAGFNDPPFTPVKGTITQTNNGAKERKETCKSDRYTVELMWHGLGDANFVEFRPGGNVLMSFAMVIASGGEIVINGKQAPGKWFSTGGGIGTGAYLTEDEIWRR
jgi:hypothetical protein